MNLLSSEAPSMHTQHLRHDCTGSSLMAGKDGQTARPLRASVAEGMILLITHSCTSPSADRPARLGDQGLSVLLDRRMGGFYYCLRVGVSSPTSEEEYGPYETTLSHGWPRQSVRRRKSGWWPTICMPRRIPAAPARLPSRTCPDGEPNTTCWVGERLSSKRTER